MKSVYFLAQIRNQHKKRHLLIYHVSSLVKVEDFVFMILVICTWIFEILRLIVNFCYSKPYQRLEMCKSIFIKLYLPFYPSKSWNCNSISDMGTKHLTFTNQPKTLATGAIFNALNGLCPDVLLTSLFFVKIAIFGEVSFTKLTLFWFRVRFELGCTKKLEANGNFQIFNFRH